MHRPCPSGTDKCEAHIHVDNGTNDCRVLNGDCSARLQVKSTMKWRTLPVWAVLSSSGSHVQEIAATLVKSISDSSNESAAL